MYDFQYGKSGTAAKIILDYKQLGRADKFLGSGR